MPKIGTALYYPYFTMSEGWLKQSLLYWDKIRRIVPEQAVEDLADPTPHLECAAAGLLLNSSPESHRERASKQFEDLIMPALTSGYATPVKQAVRAASRRGPNQLSYVHHGKMAHRLKRKLERSGLMGGDEPIHRGKMSARMRQQLQNAGLVNENLKPKTRRTKDGPLDHYMALPSSIADLYMTCLGSTMSHKMGMPLVTDQVRNGDIGQYALWGKEPAPPADRNALLFQLGVPFPSPKELSGVPMKKIIAFSEKRSQEKEQFRQEIESFVAIAKTIDSPDALQDLISQKNRQLKQALKDHKKTLTELRVNSVNKALNISCPSMIKMAAAAGVGGAIAPFLAPVILAGGFALAGANTWYSYRGKARAHANSSPMHYLLRVQKKFK